MVKTSVGNHVVLHKEFAVGSADLSGGHDWNAASQTFTININGAGVDTVTLDAACATLAACVTHIQAALDDDATTEGGTMTVTSYEGKYIVIYADDNSDQYTLGEGTGAMATIGLTA